MKKYRFYDSDDSGKEEYDITGLDYLKLLALCFKYCTSMAFRTCDYGYIKSIVPNGFEDFRIPVTDNVLAVYDHYQHRSAIMTNISGRFEIHHYNLNNKLKTVLSKYPNSVFSWLCTNEFANPEDPSFFRADGSVFFSSVTHEGECTIFLRSNESISELLTNSHWIEIK